MRKLQAEMTHVEPRRIEVCRAADRQPIYAVGEGQTHQVFAAESQVDYLRGLSGRLDLSTDRRELLIGDRRSGTSWAGLVATVSLALANRCEAAVFAGPSGLEDTHKLLRDILPPAWVDEDAEARGYYRLPRHMELHVVAHSRPETWPEDRGVVMLNDYAYASEETIEELLQRGRVQVVTGNPPMETQPGRDWILRARDRAKETGGLFRFHGKQNQFLLGNPANLERFGRVVARHSERWSFWDGTGL